MKNVTSNLSNLKIKEDKLDVDKLKPFLVDLSKISDVVKNNVVKKDINALLLLMLKYMRLKTSIITNLATTTLNAKINEVKNKIPNITNVATTAALM